MPKRRFKENDCLKRAKRSSTKCLTCGRFKTQANCHNCNRPGYSADDDDDVSELSPLPPTNADEINYPDAEYCYSCKRQSTDKYPLVLNSVCGKNLMRRKIGPETTNQQILLCSLCSKYLNTLSPEYQQSAKFKHARPAVFWFLLSDKNIEVNFWHYIPIEMRCSWLHSASICNSVFRQRMDLVSLPIFVDISFRSRVFNQFKIHWSSSEMVQNVNNEFFPCIKCPVGCGEFIDNFGKIDFVHYLSKLIPYLKSFRGDVISYLSGMRTDYEIPDFIFPDDPFAPIVKPSLLVSDDGIFLLTCKDHDKKIKEQYCHLPKHPCGRIFNPLPDRFAPAILSVRSVKPFRENFSSASYKMVKLNSSFCGSNTCFISHGKSLDKVTDCSVNHESFYLHCRQDTQCVVRKLADKGFLSQENAEIILKNRNDHWLREMRDLKEHTNFVPLETVAFMREINERRFFDPMTTIMEEEVHAVDALSADNELVTTETGSENVSFCNTASDESCQVNPRETSGAASFIENLMFPCAKVLERNLGAPPTSYLCRSENSKIVIDLTANSVLFYSNLIGATLRKSKYAWKILSCFTKKKGLSASSCFKNALRILEDDAGHQSLADIFSQLSFVSLVNVPNRQMPIQFDTSFCEKDFVVVVSSCSRQRSLLPLEKTAKINNDLFQLVYVVACNRDCFFRYKFCDKWWNITKADRPQPTVYDNISNLLNKNSWKIAIYEKLETSLSQKESSQATNSIYGQDKVYCEKHELPLACDFPKNCFVCQFDCECRLKSAWRCPSEGCESALCKKHFNTILEKSWVVPHEGKNTRHQLLVDDLIGESVVNLESCSEDMVLPCDPLTLIEMPSEAGLVDDVEATDTDTAATAVEYHSNDDLQSIGSHFIINGVCSLLNRPKNPSHFRKKDWRFLQSFVANCPDESVPLTFPEAALLPSIYYVMLKNTIGGAIPSPIYSPAVAKRFNFANIVSHIRSRLKNISLLTSGDPRLLQFYFDCYFNFQSLRRDSRLVLNRGLQEFTKVHSETNNRAKFRMNEVDSRKIVNELAAAIRLEEPTFFLTFTLNMSRMFGVAPLFQLIEKNCKGLSTEQQHILKESFMPLYMRLWERAVVFFIEYLEKSTEKPLGTVTNIFPRFEFQTSKGNAPHLHVIVWTAESKNDPVILNKVLGSFRQLLHQLNVELFDSSNKNVTSKEDVDGLLTLAKSLLSHNCEKASYRCHKKCDNSGKMVCRFHIFEPCSETFFKPVERPHTPEVWSILQHLGLARPHDKVDGAFHIDEVLQGGKFNYAADYGETFSPVNCKLFSLLQCSMNCLLCDRVMSASYLAKYAAGIEEHATVNISGKSDTTVSICVKSLKNLKIAGAELAAKSEKTKTSTKNCRVLSTTECVWSMLDLRYVFPTYECVHVNTLPLENRGGFVKRKSNAPVADSAAEEDQALHFVKMRIILQSDSRRYFTINQIRTVKEFTKSGLTIDKVSLFAMRPPELLFVNNIEFFFRHFTFVKLDKKSTTSMYSNSLHDSCWIDAIGNIVKLRSQSIPFFQQFLFQSRQSPSSSYSFFSNFYENFFSTTFNINHLVDYSAEKQKPAVVVFPNVIPKHVPNFLISFLLQFGRYETEFDLFETGNIATAYARAGLIKDAASVNDMDTNELLKLFILQRVMFIPGSHVSQDRQIVDAKNAFCFLNESQELIETPTIVYNALQQECSEELNRSVTSKITNVTKQVHSLITDAQKPTIDSLIDCQVDIPLNYNPLHSNGLHFNAEQTFVLQNLIHIIDSFVNSAASFFKYQFVVGMPGSGKTFVTIHSLFYALCKGLNVMITSLSSERAMQFSGMHIHDLFGLPVSQSLSVDEIVEKALQKLDFDFVKLTLLKRLDVLYFEEIGMVSSEEFASIDLILQKVRENYQPFGGVLVFATGDPKQLPPPQGRLIWTSPIVITIVQMYALKQCVRMVEKVGRKFLDMLSGSDIDEAECKLIIDTFAQHCSFVSHDNCPIDAVRIFGTRAAESKAVAHQISVLRSSGIFVSEIKSSDEVKINSSSNWKEVSSVHVKVLSKVCLEPRILYCYENALFRFTMNMPSLHVSQGQLCVFLNFLGSVTIEVMAAPPGVRCLPPRDTFGNFLFEENGWFRVIVHKQAGFVHGCRGSSVRRVQYPLKNFLAMTIHKAMGETIGKIVTRIDCIEREYNLWEKEQLYVLASRVQRLSDLTFIGSKQNTLNAIKCLLIKKNQWDKYTEQLVNTASNQTPAVFDVAKFSPFRPQKLEIPNEAVGFVYLLVSIKDVTSFYVGETSELRRGLLQHNSGQSSFFTFQPHLRPWGLLAFATGFSDIAEENQIQRKTLERTIKDEIFKKFHAFNRSGSPNEVLGVFLDCIQQAKFEINCLRAVITGSILQS